MVFSRLLFSKFRGRKAPGKSPTQKGNTATTPNSQNKRGKRHCPTIPNLLQFLKRKPNKVCHLLSTYLHHASAQCNISYYSSSFIHRLPVLNTLILLQTQKVMYHMEKVTNSINVWIRKPLKTMKTRPRRSSMLTQPPQAPWPKLKPVENNHEQHLCAE